MSVSLAGGGARICANRNLKLVGANRAYKTQRIFQYNRPDILQYDKAQLISHYIQISITKSVSGILGMKKEVCRLVRYSYYCPAHIT